MRELCLRPSGARFNIKKMSLSFSLKYCFSFGLIIPPLRKLRKNEQFTHHVTESKSIFRAQLCYRVSQPLVPKVLFTFSESSSGCWAILQLPCCPSKQGELLENILQNLRNKWPPHPVLDRPPAELLRLEDLLRRRRLHPRHGGLHAQQLLRRHRQRPHVGQLERRLVHVLCAFTAQ